MVLALTLVAGMLTGCGGAKEEAPAAAPMQPGMGGMGGMM